MTERKPDRDAMVEQRLSTADVATAGQRSQDQPIAGQGSAKSAEPPTDVQMTSSAARHAATPPVSLLAADEANTFRSRWSSIQTGFVDEPRQAVEQADTLVAEVMQRLAETFTNERDRLEDQWSQGDNVSTEDLRVALQRYRSFFDRLLAV